MMRALELCEECGAETFWDASAFLFVCEHNHRSTTARKMDFGKNPADCEHPDFMANVRVGRMLDSGKFIAEIRVRCARCGEPFRFIGVPAGLAWDHPSCTIDGLMLQAPCEPELEKKLHDRASYQMPDIPKQH
jgi:hypothetical protein